MFCREMFAFDYYVSNNKNMYRKLKALHDEAKERARCLKSFCKKYKITSYNPELTLFGMEDHPDFRRTKHGHKVKRDTDAATRLDHIKSLSCSVAARTSALAHFDLRPFSGYMYRGYFRDPALYLDETKETTTLFLPRRVRSKVLAKIPSHFKQRKTEPCVSKSLVL